MKIRHLPLILMYVNKRYSDVWYMINKKENYSSIRETCRRGEFDNLYNMVKRR